VVVALGTQQAAGKDEGCPVRFTDIAASAGLKFNHERGATAEHRLPETMGSGLAWLDYDNDGWMDLYVVQSGPFPPNGSPKAQDRLYHNNHDGTFTDVTEKAGLHDTAYGMGVVAADYDNDGWTDLYVTNFGQNILYHNNHDGTFTNVTEKAGVGGSGWSTSAAFADLHGNGLLDLFVARYLDYSIEKEQACVEPESGRRIYCYPSFYPSASNLLYRNNGDGTFTDITASSGIGKAQGKALGVVIADFDDDGRPDIYVANDTVMNFLFHNLGNGRFQDVSLPSGAGLNATGRPFGGMGVNVGDLHGAGRLDIVVANYEAEPKSLFRNVGDGVFEDVSDRSGFGAPGLHLVSFGLNLFDAGNLGRLDAFITNGHIQEHPKTPGVGYAERLQLLWNDGRGHFTERGCGEPFQQAFVGRGSAAADFDNDGDIDIAVSNSGGPLQLLRNDGRHGGWVGFLLRGTRSNRQGIGARVMLETTAGRQIREVRAGDSYMSSSDPRVHFGLGDATIKKVEIRWPSGIVQQVENVRPSGYQVIVEKAATRAAGKR
jgi:hypothetical protein